MRLAAATRALVFGALWGAAYAQDNNGNGGSSTSSASRPTASANATSTSSDPNRVVTTITSLVAGPSGSPSQTATFVLTLTVPSGNTSAPLNSTIGGNSTASSNGTLTNVTKGPWNDTLGYLPFSPPLDAAYGTGGILLILSGVPVAILGGKNRWSALAIVSGYSVALFTLVIILSFGVSPALEPPSPDPPTAAMRGLYLLAVGISCLIGAGLGIFFYTFAKYWVGAAGGFCFGWFLMALRKGGLVRSTGGRWAIIGGLTVVALLGSLTPKLHDAVLLAASAWIGATAFTLGVDCFSRAGLKEFYIYNLGYWQLFPSLNGGKYPHTQSMQVELGVIAAAALIAGAVQFKIVNILKKRRKQISTEEEARREADAIERAAENFKNVDAELAEWEGKHGAPGSSGSGSGLHTPTKGLGPTLPTLEFGQRTPSTLVGGGHNHSPNPSPGTKEVLTMPTPSPPPEPPRRLSLMEEMGLEEPMSPRTPVSPTPTDPELEQKLQLLSEVRRARQSIRSSMDQLRSTTNTPAFGSDGSRPGTAMFADRAESAAGSYARSRNDSMASSRLLDGPVHRHNSTNSHRPERHSRHYSGASSRLLDDEPRLRHDSTASSRFFDDRSRRDSLGPRTFTPTEAERRQSMVENLDSRVSLVEPREPRRASMSERAPVSEWEQYTQSRNIISQPAPQPQYSVVSNAVVQSLSHRNSLQPTGPTPAQEYGAHLSRALSMEAERQPVVMPQTSAERPRNARTMTTEELADRHRELLTRMQDRVSGPMREEIAVAHAREEWTERQKAERAAQKKRESLPLAAVAVPPVVEKKKPRHERGDTAGAPKSKTERAKRTEEWRRSLQQAVSPPRASHARTGSGQQTTQASSYQPGASPAHGPHSNPTSPSAPPIALPRAQRTPNRRGSHANVDIA